MSIYSLDLMADLLTPPGSPPEEPHLETPQHPHYTAEYASLVKNKSTSNLLAHSRAARVPLTVDSAAKRMSIDAGQLERMAR